MAISNGSGDDDAVTPIESVSNGEMRSSVAEEFSNAMLKRVLGTLDPGYFAWVMGSGIVSIGMYLLGYIVLSQVILVVTVAAFILLCCAYLIRAIWFWPQFVQSLREPGTAMAYFTVVAGTDVLAIRLLMTGYQIPTIVLGTFAALVWLALTYGLPSFIVVRAHRPIFRDLNGTWLIWVVATQSLAIVASGLASTTTSIFLATMLPAIAVSLWGVGVMLYLILIVMIFFRLFLVEVTPAEMGPAYWIAMGATAISARAAAGILLLKDPHAHMIINDLRPFLIGLSVVLWAFGTWWIPLLVLFGLWRYVFRGYSRAYEPRLWSVVFPLGMYTVASYTLGSVTKLSFMVTIARVWVWVGGGAWLVVFLLMVGALIRALRGSISKSTFR